MRTRQRGAGKVLRKRKFHRQNPLELETPNLLEWSVFLLFVAKAKHEKHPRSEQPSNLGLD
jgi:hypothetical protein